MLILTLDGGVGLVEKNEDIGKQYVQGQISSNDLARVKSLISDGIEKKRYSQPLEMHAPTYSIQFKVVHSPTNSDVFVGDQSIGKTREGPIGDILNLMRSTEITRRTLKRGKLKAPTYW